MIDDINLQLFAEERKEPATPRRRNMAREKGQIAQSQDLVSAAGLLAGAMGFRFGLPWVARLVTGRCQAIWTASLPKEVNDGWALACLGDVLGVCLLAAAPVAVVALLSGVAVSALQTGVGVRLNLIAPDLHKVNPFEGTKRILSRRALVDGLRTLLKISAVGLCAWLTLRGAWSELSSLAVREVPDSLRLLESLAMGLAVNCGGLLLLLGALDYAYQWWELERSLMMTEREVRDEMRDAEVKPEVKRVIRARQRMFAQRRMMQEVPKADAVIVNPEHYAVAIKYDTEVHAAPLVVAKGLDEVALRIRKVALESRVQVVSNPPLARALYRAVEIGEMVPEDLYEAVAEVLAYVYRLAGKAL